MYPPTGRYASLPTGSESSPNPRQLYHNSPSISARWALLRRKRVFRSFVLVASVLLGFVLFDTFFNSSPEEVVIWSEDALVFEAGKRPEYLDIPLEKPIVIRLAIISHVAEFGKRKVSRETVLTGIPKTDVKLDYKFFVGRAEDGISAWPTRLRLAWENLVHGDIIVLNELRDVPQRLSEKRYSALQWTNSVPHDQYDYSMTMDSDTFCRFRTLARRLHHEYSELKPKEQPILIGRMAGHLVYFENTIPDGNINDDDEDFFIKGPWYSYPMGIGYMLSSNLTEILLSADPPLPHHINYPSDDVMIGGWIAGLKLFHDPSVYFETTVEHSPPPQHRVYPKPYLPYMVDTNVIDDKIGWHDFKNRSGNDGTIGWETACVHRISPAEMRAFRAMEEINMEWEAPRGLFSGGVYANTW